MLKLPHLKTPSIFVILGATGDLANRKIIPSLWRLFQEGLLPDKCFILAFANTALTFEEFQNYIKKTLGGLIKNSSLDDLHSFLGFFAYTSGDFKSEESFKKIAIQLKKIEDGWGVCSNKVFFLAATPIFYETIFHNLAKVKLNLPCGGDLGWTRILIEKPFGHDLQSSQKLQKLLSKYFKEEQVYRIDHYLAKEIVQGISNFRFSNNLFEHAWNNTLIEKIEIRLFETIGVEQRGSFYDAFGAFRDVGQNHLLEMLALITMKFPEKKDPFAVRKSRTEIIKTLKKWDKNLIIQNTYRGQYEGYKNIEGVKKDSQTETLFAIKTELDDPAWKGIPIIIEGGKRCQQASKEIVVTMRHSTFCFLCEPGHHTKNQVIFQIEPKNQILIKFWTKKPGYETKLEERFFNFFLYEKEDETPYVEEYAKLFYAAMAGDQTIFASKEEVESLWRFTDPVIKAWKENLVPLQIYKQGVTPKVTFGQETEGEAFVKKIGVIGLGKMGANLSRRLMEKGWQVHGYNKTSEETKSLEKEGLRGAYSLEELLKNLSRLGDPALRESLATRTPKIIWLMVPAGKPVDEILFGNNGLSGQLKKGDIVIDGGNSFYKDSVARFKKLQTKGIHFIDVGVSGGPGGARSGASLMIGGNKSVSQKLEGLFGDLAKENGYQFFDGAGAGHFVKMVHNGIEYGMMQAIAEGFTVLKQSKYNLDLSNVTDIYNNGSVIESRLVEWLKKAFELRGQNLKSVSGSVGYTGEGEWTVKTAKEMKIKVKIIEEALKLRVNSAKKPSYTGKVLSAMREQFGGHSIKGK